MSMNDFVSAGSHRMSKVMTFAFAWSQKPKNGQDLASAGSQKNKCDLAFAEDQHIKIFGSRDNFLLDIVSENHETIFKFMIFFERMHV